MKFTLKNCPDSGWKRGFEKELREKPASLDKSIFKGPQGYDVTRTRCNLEKILEDCGS